MIKKLKTKQKHQRKAKFNLIYLYIILFAAVVIGGLCLAWKSSQITTFKQISGDTWSFSPPVTNGTTKGPRFGQGVVKPRKPVMGGKQRVTISISDTAPVKKVTAVLTTDSKTSIPYELLPGSGTSYNSDWTGTWFIEDTYLSKYTLSIQATSSNGTTSITIPLK